MSLKIMNVENKKIVSINKPASNHLKKSINLTRNQMIATIIK